MPTQQRAWPLPKRAWTWHDFPTASDWEGYGVEEKAIREMLAGPMQTGRSPFAGAAFVSERGGGPQQGCQACEKKLQKCLKRSLSIYPLLLMLTTSRTPFI